MNALIGMGVALVTPFKKDGSVDHQSLVEIVEFNIQNGTDYLVISGTTGESVTITKQEKKILLKLLSIPMLVDYHWLLELVVTIPLR